jgi:hypothetical protein
LSGARAPRSGTSLPPELCQPPRPLAVRPEHAAARGHCISLGPRPPLPVLVRPRSALNGGGCKRVPPCFMSACPTPLPPPPPESRRQAALAHNQYAQTCQTDAPAAAAPTTAAASCRVLQTQRGGGLEPVCAPKTAPTTPVLDDARVTGVPVPLQWHVRPPPCRRARPAAPTACSRTRWLRQQGAAAPQRRALGADGRCPAAGSRPPRPENPQMLCLLPPWRWPHQPPCCASLPSVLAMPGRPQTPPRGPPVHGLLAWPSAAPWPVCAAALNAARTKPVTRLNPPHTHAAGRFWDARAASLSLPRAPWGHWQTARGAQQAQLAQPPPRRTLNSDPSTLPARLPSLPSPRLCTPAAPSSTCP